MTIHQLEWAILPGRHAALPPEPPPPPGSQAPGSGFPSPDLGAPAGSLYPTYDSASVSRLLSRITPRSPSPTVTRSLALYVCVCVLCCPSQHCCTVLQIPPMSIGQTDPLVEG